MIVAFTGVLIIASSKPMSTSDSASDNKLFGSICSCTVASCYALVSVLTRKMQALHYSIVLFYYAIFSVLALMAILIIESYIKDEPLRILTLSWYQIGLMTLTSTFNTFGLVFNTIALQNEKSGFITSIGYISIVYSFMGDLIVFDQSFSFQELIGATIIIAVIVFLLAKELGLLKQK